jgi:hypothetical protein
MGKKRAAHRCAAKFREETSKKNNNDHVTVADMSYTGLIARMQVIFCIAT